MALNTNGVTKMATTHKENNEIKPSDLDRNNITFKDGEEGRVYYDSASELICPSVTTVTHQRVDPDKEAALEGWRSRYDGSSEYCSPHWEEQMKYKGWRGTLAHYNCLSPLGDTSAGVESYHDAVGDERGMEEYEAEYKLKTYGEYDGDDAWNSAMREIHWVYNKFFDDVAPDLGISQESTIDVERYALDTTYGYAGQFDLLYENPDGDTVLADLKTSSGIREDYKLQLAAYAKAIDEDVDTLQVIRIYPDKKEVEVQTNEDWSRSIDSYYEQFLGLVYKTLSSVPDDYFD
jgi:hypothetical protein